MSAEKIIEKILSDAHAEAQHILADTRAQAQQLRQQAQAEAQRQYEQILAQAREEAQSRRRAHQSQAQLAARGAVLSARRAVLDRVFAEARARLEQMSIGEYKAWLLQTILQAVQTGDEELLLSPQDKQALGEVFLKELNSKLSQMGKRGQLKYSRETRELGRGFVLKGQTFESNASLAMLLRRAQEKLEIEIARKLFT